MPLPLSDADLERVRATVTNGNKIEAIKLYRELTGVGLAEAKSAVEAIEARRQVGTPPLAAASNNDIDQIQAAIFAGNKIQAIKLYRTATGEGLKESKGFIDALEAELRRTDPDKFTAPPLRGCGVAAAILLAFAAGLSSLLLGTLL
jgi:ribosomal protein L7/L12